MGRGLKPFTIYKFRTMFHEGAVEGRAITPAGDPRVTRLGGLLRRLKFDELPQLFNVLKGDMSLVGPRPEVPRYVNLFRSDYEEILRIRPGITDLASLKYRDEASLLAKATDPDTLYLQQVLPDKIRLAKEYVRMSSLAYDIRLIFKTILGLPG
jgi:lipopolysaccharide/colanic/teichoic acid biosynthesis glycosyltransferase